MFDFSYRSNERCYFEMAKKALEAASDEEVCEKIVVRYSYGEISAEDYREHYNSDFWQVRKISWIVTVPFRLVWTIYGLAEILFLSQSDPKLAITKFLVARIFEHAVGDLLCIFNDRAGQRLTSDASVHIKLYLLANKSFHEERRTLLKECFYERPGPIPYDPEVHAFTFGQKA